MAPVFEIRPVETAKSMSYQSLRHSRGVFMPTWPELLAQLKHLQKLVAKHQGSKSKDLEKQIVRLEAQARKMISRELESAQEKTQNSP
jgi:hypothetical protein